MSKLLIDDKPVEVLPKLAEAIGLNKAIVLQQIHYWLVTYEEADKERHFRDGKWWVYNTKQGWQENFPWWSKSTVWRALTELREDGLVETTSKYNRKGYDRTLWYTIDREDNVSKLLMSLEDYERFAGKPWEPPDKKGPEFDPALYRRNRKYAMQKNDGLCVYCGRPATTIDHVTPRSQGGSNSLDNLVPCCADCNRRKKARTPKEWLENEQL